MHRLLRYHERQLVLSCNTVWSGSASWASNTSSLGWTLSSRVDGARGMAFPLTSKLSFEGGFHGTLHSPNSAFKEHWVAPVFRSWVIPRFVLRIRHFFSFMSTAISSTILDVWVFFHGIFSRGHPLVPYGLIASHRLPEFAKFPSSCCHPECIVLMCSLHLRRNSAPWIFLYKAAVILGFCCRTNVVKYIDCLLSWGVQKDGGFVLQTEWPFGSRGQ